ncbi:MAG: FtsH protease activity modulator HflK [Rhodospirillaceae bacterium]
MAWNQNGGGGGPWGGGSGGGGGGGGPWGNSPWGGGNRGGGGRNNGPMGSPPDLEDLLRKSQDRFKKVMPGGMGPKSIIILIIVALGVWMATGFYRVAADEKGVVKRFGAYVYTTDPGLHYHLPYPIETVQTPKVTRENRVEIGFRSNDGARSANDRPGDRLEESLMLTGDENIIDIDFSVVWVIEDPANFLFNLRDPESAVILAAESAMREVIGQTTIQVALTEGREQIESRTREKLQELMRDYQAGISIRRVQLLKVDPPAQVVDAFNDVQRARADLERLRNEAEAYANSVIPEARGRAERLRQEAQAYREEIVNRAEGDASRFTAVYQAYKVAPDVTERRIYLETLEQVLGNVNKVIVDQNGDSGGTGVVPYLPLPEIQKRSTGSASAGGNN